MHFPFRHSLPAHRSQTLRRTGKTFSASWRRPPGNRKAVRTLFAVIVPFLLVGSDGWAKHTADVQEIPFELYQNHLVVVSGSLGRLERRKLVIDTGTNPTLLDNATAHELGLQPVGQSSGSLNVVDRIVPTYYSILPTLHFGPIHRESLQVAVADLSWLRKQAGIQVDAVIGLDALSQINFQIDYQSRRISFGAIHTLRSSVPMAESDRLLMVQARLNGVPARLMIDTGGSALVLFAGTLPESTSWRALGTAVTFSNLAGQTMLQKVQLKQFRVGETNLGGTIALVEETPRCCNFQGILGISSRKFRRIAFDFKLQLVGFELQDSNLFDSAEAVLCRRPFETSFCPNAVPLGVGIR